MEALQLASAARTVLSVAGHMELLRERAVVMRAEFQARHRGYFTPSEDEQVRHLLVSYTQARNALLELIASLQAQDSPYNPADPRPFAVGYAAAIVLVDAARFLRDMWDRDPIVRRKLDEPEPYFGIEGGTYQRIQKSLTSPYHAWHLYRANHFYDRIEPTLRSSVAGDDLMGGVVQIIDRLGERVRVSKGRYLLARLRVRRRGIRHRLRAGAMAAAIYAVQEYASRLTSRVSVRPWHRPGLPAGVRQQLLEILRPGDVLVTRKEHAATNYFLPGFWPHGSLYLGTARDMERLSIADHPNVKARWPRIEGEGPRVLEALKDGVWLRPVDSPFASDCIIAIRPAMGEAEIAAAIARGMFHEGKPYDFDFDFTRSDRLVCTEVVYRSYEGIGSMRFDLKRRAGRMTLAAEDLLALARQRRGWAPVAAFCPGLCGALVHGNEVDRVLDQTMGDRCVSSLVAAAT